MDLFVCDLPVFWKSLAKVFLVLVLLGEVLQFQVLVSFCQTWLGSYIPEPNKCAKTLLNTTAQEGTPTFYTYACFAREENSEHLGVSKNTGTPKWMVYTGKTDEQMDDLGGPPLFLETPTCFIPTIAPLILHQQLDPLDRRRGTFHAHMEF